MTNIYDDYAEIVKWDEDDLDRKWLSDQYSTDPFAVLKAGYDFTGIDDDINSIERVLFDGRWSSTINTDSPSLGDNFDYVELEEVLTTTEVPVATINVGSNFAGVEFWQSETITPNGDMDVRFIAIRIFNINLTPADIILRIRNGVGGGVLISSDPVPFGEVAIGGVGGPWQIFKLPATYTMLDATPYQVTVETTGASAVNNFYGVQMNNANPYPDGTIWQQGVAPVGWPPNGAWVQQAANDLLMILYGPEGETEWTNEWDVPYERLAGAEIDTHFGEGMFIGPDRVNAAILRRVLQKDQHSFGRYSGDNMFLIKFKSPRSQPAGVPAGLHWKFYFLCQNCQTNVDFLANGAGYYAEFTGGASRLDIHYFDNAIAADVVLGTIALGAILPNVEYVLAICIGYRHLAIVPRNFIEVYLEVAGTVQPYVPAIVINRGALPVGQQYHNGTVMFESSDTGTAVNELTGAEILHFNIYGRLFDSDPNAVVGRNRFLWAPEESWSLPDNWTLSETLNWVYRAFESDLITSFEMRLCVRNKLGWEAWNSDRATPLFRYGCFRNVNVTNLAPILIMDIPRLVILGIPFSLDFTNSFDPEEGHIGIAIQMGDDTQTRTISTQIQHPATQHTYYQESNPIDGGVNSGLGYLVKAICVDKAFLVSPEVTTRIWVTQGFATEDVTYTPLFGFESISESVSESGIGRNNAPFFGGDVITGTYGGSKEWAIAGKHIVIGAQKMGKTEQQLQDMVLYEHLLFRLLSKYGVIFLLNLGDGQIVRGVMTDYESNPTHNPHVRDYSFTFIQIWKPWKSMGRDLII